MRHTKCKVNHFNQYIPYPLRPANKLKMDKFKLDKLKSLLLTILCQCKNIFSSRCNLYVIHQELWDFIDIPTWLFTRRKYATSNQECWNAGAADNSVYKLFVKTSQYWFSTPNFWNQIIFLFDSSHLNQCKNTPAQNSVILTRCTKLFKTWLSLQEAEHLSRVIIITDPNRTVKSAF